MTLEEFIDYNEIIRWRGRPPFGLLLRSYDIFLIPFSIIWTGMAFFIFLNALFAFEDIGYFDPFFILPAFFVIMGIYIVIGRFVVDSIVRIRTEYAVTDSRAIIVSGVFGRSFETMPLTRDLQIQVTGNKRGSIRFGPGHGFFDMTNGFGIWRGPQHPFVFERIKNVQEVYKLIREVQMKSK